MTRRTTFLLFLLCPLASGCGGLLGIGARNLVNEAQLARDDHFERIHYACLAGDAWEKLVTHCPPGTYSADHATGFRAGFVDYLYAGGYGEPPTLPPKRYRHIHAESPRGVQALRDWYEGFRHGAAAAKESGLRSLVVVSLARPAPPPPPPPPPPPDLLLPGGPELPVPRKLPGAALPETGRAEPDEAPTGTGELLPGDRESPPPSRGGEGVEAGEAAERMTKSSGADNAAEERRP